MKRKLLSGIFYLAMFLVFTAAVMLLWNKVLSQITHVSTINYWQSLCLMLLCHILFGGIPGKCFWLLKRIYGSQHPLKNKLLDMDEADRRAFKEEWRKRHGDDAN